MSPGTWVAPSLAAALVMGSWSWALGQTVPDAGPSETLSFGRGSLVGAPRGTDSQRWAEVVRSDLPRLRACREHGPGVNPDLDGALDVRLTVDGEGRVTEVVFPRDARWAPLSACLEPHLRRRVFPARAGGRPVRYAFSLEVRPVPASARGAFGEGGPPRINSPTPIVAPALPREAVRAVVRSHRGEADRCHERGLALNPALAGSVLIRFVVQRDGTVSEATVEESPEPMRMVAECIASAFTRWTFPQPTGDGPVTLTYPFNY